MAPVTKSNQKSILIGAQQGQISIFFSASLVVFISIIAFVINVGLFVKAKINLQNATDAAAFAGAAVQSRQLTKIAYLNWEMRNIFKEWMYKYYVVGNLNAPMVQNTTNPDSCGSENCMDFRLQPDRNVITGQVAKDHYNIPSTCIHISESNTNICRHFGVPGLPEFGGSSMAGTEEASRAFQDVLIGNKLNDCVERSRLNMLVATTWAYNILSNDMESTLAGRGPAILSDRQGAWPRAIELALRIRNLEKVVNREAVTQPVCIGGGDCTSIDQFSSAKMLGNERIVKAFYSGYRNLGNHIDNEMKNSFKLREISPVALPPQNIYSNSSLLIPNLYSKQYLDLKLMMVNYTTFFTAFVPRADKNVSAGCGVSKVAIPVPGYPLGFYKNPDVLTYYAVKGEAEFEGMFNPFSSDKIKLTAYSAAKPAGGRIGPMLFKQKPAEQAIRLRSNPDKFRSIPYLASLDITGTENPYLDDRKLDLGEFAPGAPLPININADSPFWVKNADSPVGGLAMGDDVQFGIPNLVYDYIAPGAGPGSGNFNPSSYTDKGSSLFTITPADPEGDRAVGLFNFDQFKAFKGNIGGIVTPEELADQITRVRAATRYEAANYLIPTPNDFNLAKGVDSFGIINGSPTQVATIPGLVRYTTDIYAPLYKGANDQQDLLFASTSDVLSAIVNFMRTQQAGIDNYIRSMNRAAVETYRTADNASAAAVEAKSFYEQGGKKISDIDVANPDPDYYKTAFPKSCGSLAGQFYEFYYGDQTLFPDKIVDKTSTPCPTNLVELLRKYFAAAASDPNFNPTHYRMEYSYYPANWPSPYQIFSAYTPGPYTGVDQSGTLTPPPNFPGNDSKEIMRRNFYSTKFVTINSLRSGGKYDESSKFPIYSEGNINTFPGLDYSQSTFANPLNTATEDLDNIKY